MGKTYYEFEVELAGSKPRIWRRFCLRTSATFEALHAAIQDAFDWGGHHLYEFCEAGRGGETLCGHEALDEEGLEVASRVKLKGFFGEPEALKNKACVYMYDFGDGWEHKVKLKRVVELDEVFTRRMTGGGAPSAIDDCGGVWGYQRLLEEAAQGDKEARAQLSCRPAEFVLDAVKAGFDIPRQARPRAAQVVEAPKVAAPKVAAPAVEPSGQRPSAEVAEEVARLLMERLRGDASLAGVIALASQRWAALVKRELPRKKPALWAAALEYAATREQGGGRKQGEIAAAYGVSGPAVSMAWPLVAALLEQPAEVAPAKSAPAKSAPAKSAPAKSAPAKSAPAPRVKAEPVKTAAQAPAAQRGTSAAEVEALLVEALEGHDVERAQIELACARWGAFAGEIGPLTKRAATYVAAMEYITRMTSADHAMQRSQDEVAEAYGLSKQTLGGTAREIIATLGLELERRHMSEWSPHTSPMELLMKLAARGGMVDEEWDDEEEWDWVDEPDDEPEQPEPPMWDSETLEALRALPRDEADVWELTVEFLWAEQRATSFWCSRQDAMRFGISPMELDAHGELDGGVLLAALAMSWTSSPGKSLPGLLVCDDPQNAERLSAAMEALGVRVGVERLTSVLRFQYSTFRAMAIEAGELAQASDDSVEDSFAELSHQSARLWEAAPWRVAAEVQIIEVRDKMRMRCMSVVGERGDLLALMLFESVGDWEKVYKAIQRGEEPKVGWLALEFVHKFALSDEERERLGRVGPPDMAFDAYPVLSRWTARGTAPIRAADCELMSAAIEGLLSMLAERPKLFEEPLDKLTATAAGLTFVAPHSAARRCWVRLGTLSHPWA